MKQNKDVINSQLSDSEITNFVTCIVNGLHPTHIAIAPPLDTNADFITNGNSPSPRTVEAHFAIWCSTIHSLGVKVLYRGTFCNFENLYNFPLKPNGVIPQGTAASAATDGTSTWLGRVYQRILTLGSNFQSGDIWAPFPEQTGGQWGTVFGGQSFLSTGGSGIQTNYANYFNDLISVSNAAFTAAGVTGVLTGHSTNNYSEIRSGWIPGSVFSNSHLVTVDYYGNYNSDGYEPSAYKADFDTVYSSKNQKIFQQEWADLNNSGVSEKDRLYYVDRYYRMITQEQQAGKFVGFNYWGGWSGGVESIVYKDANGNYKLNGRGKILSRYFNGTGLRGYPLPDANGNF